MNAETTFPPRAQEVQSAWLWGISKDTCPASLAWWRPRLRERHATQECNGRCPRIPRDVTFRRDEELATPSLTQGLLRSFFVSQRMWHDDTVVEIKIQNIVASGRIADSLDLQALSLAMDDDDVTYRPKQFPGLVYRMRRPKVAILLFSTGKTVCTGGKSVEQAREAVRKVAEIVTAAGTKVRDKQDVEIQNIVATADLNTDFDLSLLATTLLSEGVEYEPEQFPGLVYRIKEPKAVILVFQSGKVVCTGTRTPEDAALAVDRFLDAVKGVY